MGKKKDEKKKKPCKKEFMIETDCPDVDNQSVFLNTLAILKDFCNDNVLSLKPLLDEVEDDEIIQERIINFVTISDILDSVQKLVENDIEKDCGCKKKCKKDE